MFADADRAPHSPTRARDRHHTQVKQALPQRRMCELVPREVCVMCPRRGAVCAALLLLLLLLADLATADLEKRTDMSSMPFVMGSRYGRSSPPKLIAPRNDRFFMGSRYGKRSEGTVGGGNSVGATLAGGGGLLCEYTGVFPLYRCVRHNKRDHYDARSADEAGMAEEE
ncbi:unnamed protein product [Arctia plantaginis]|uniref:RYamide n=1 Tax=Arctia plantaginis TaxID=874455 RepID=A0A8S1A9Z8_ARCPL|nr:unnamed protein product [Arctia plantaginis]